ncbi:hypothetical protein BRD13_03950 [Halobacteriales archaeon SW_5_70_135]|nr:MAG: hypothetical protein BRD13_03950 [Halobacteriales archaeon SW_5_70_135]
MNKHFEDARYYLKRAGEHAKLGLREELEPVEGAEGETKAAIADARERIAAYRSEREAETAESG